MPRISVVIPTYQSVRFVRESIESVLSQTFKDYEVIVVDGGSTDGTKELLEDYKQLINLIEQTGKGISNARNIGIKLSRGEFIAFLDSDDAWLPTKLQRQIDMFNTQPNKVGLIYADAIFFQEEENNSMDFQLKGKRAFQVGRPRRGKILPQLCMGNLVPLSTVMVRRLCFEKVGLFDESLPAAEDFDMWLRIAASYDIDYLDVVLARIRLHANSIAHDPTRLSLGQVALKKRIARNMPYLLEKFDSRKIDRYCFEPYLAAGASHLLRNETTEARRYIKQYVVACPDDPIAHALLLLTYFPFKLLGRISLYNRTLKVLDKIVFGKLREVI